MSNQYEPIPIPFSEKLRRFKHRGVPIVIFLLVATLVFYLWDMRVNTPGFSGKVIADSAMVTSPYDGKLDQFVWTSFDRVEKGEPVATIIRADSGYFRARLNLVSSMINQVREGMEPVIDRQRNMIDYENLRLDNIEQRIDLASLRIQERRLKAEYERAKEIHRLNGLSDSELELAESEYLIVTSELEQKEQLVERLSDRLERIEKYIVEEDAGTPLAAAINVYEKELEVVEEELKPVTIYAPISGIISKTFKGNGQYVRAGDPIFEIEATQPSYIVGYVRQPFDIIPEEGMQVQVRTRKPSRSFFQSYILRVGGHIEPMEASLRRPGIEVESGLPVQIALNNSEDIKLYPGEIVDIVLKP